MAKYVKLPVVIDAFKFEGSIDYANSDVPSWFCRKVETGEVLDNDTTLSIPTPEAVMTASIGDYIIKGVNGELYPCKPDIFKKTYEGLE